MKKNEEIVIDRKDEKQQSKRFRKATTKLIKELKKYKIDAENVKHGNGYFIFDFGDNSVVHFKVKQAPGWLFGLWWTLPEDYKDFKTHKKKTPHYIKGQLFAQYEENIDKFKPSASANMIEISARPEDKEDDSDAWYASTFINFIIKEPALAFCRDERYWDYNREYHSRREAKRCFAKFKRIQKWKKKLIPKLDKKALQRVKEYFKDYFEEDSLCFIDRGEDWITPRYEIIGRISQLEAAEGPGDYALYNEDEEEERQAVLNYFEKLDKKTKDEFFWYHPINFFITMKTDKDYEKTKKKCGIEV